MVDIIASVRPDAGGCSNTLDTSMFTFSMVQENIVFHIVLNFRRRNQWLEKSRISGEYGNGRIRKDGRRCWKVYLNSADNTGRNCR